MKIEESSILNAGKKGISPTEYEEKNEQRSFLPERATSKEGANFDNTAGIQFKRGDDREAMEKTKETLSPRKREGPENQA